MIGSVVDGRFEIVAPLGTGKSTTTYVAIDRSTNDRVALRVVHPTIVERCLQLEPRYIEQFRAMVVRRQLLNEHIIEIAQVTYDGSRLYAVGELVDDRLELEVKPWRQALEIVSQLCEAAHALNACAIYGNGFAPSKVYLEPHAKLDVFSVPRPDRFGAQQIHASPYLAPEHVMGKGLDPRTDVFSLGALAYHLCTGRMPFEATSPAALLTAQSKGPRPTELPEPVDRVLRTCLQNGPSARYANARELRDAIAALSLAS